MKRFILPVVLFLILGAVSYFIWKEFAKPKLPAIETFTQPTEAPIVSCSPGDNNCADKNEKIKAKKLTGANVEYAKHQCDSPRGCDIPDEKTVNTAISVIRSYAKNSKLALTRVTGINPAKIMYFCSNDNRCWGYNTKQNVVIPTPNNANSSTTASPSGDKKE